MTSTTNVNEIIKDGLHFLCVWDSKNTLGVLLYCHYVNASDGEERGQ